MGVGYMFGIVRSVWREETKRRRGDGYSVKVEEVGC